MLTKNRVKKSIENLPDSFSIDQLIDHLIFIEKIEKGIEQSEDERSFPMRILKV